MSYKDDGVSLGEGLVKAVTKQSILVYTEDFGEEWIPLSQIHDDSELYDNAKRGDEGELVVTQWLADKRGWS
jgi:hypothetical protein